MPRQDDPKNPKSKKPKLPTRILNMDSADDLDILAELLRPKTVPVTPTPPEMLYPESSELGQMSAVDREAEIDRRIAMRDRDARSAALAKLSAGKSGLGVGSMGDLGPFPTGPQIDQLPPVDVTPTPPGALYPKDSPIGSLTDADREALIDARIATRGGPEQPTQEPGPSTPDLKYDIHELTPEDMAKARVMAQNIPDPEVMPNQGEVPPKPADQGPPAPMPSKDLLGNMAGPGMPKQEGAGLLEALAIITAGLNRKSGPGDMVKLGEMLSGKSGGGVSGNTAARIQSSERGRAESRDFRAGENAKNRDLQRELAGVRHKGQVELRNMKEPKEFDADLAMSRERLNNPELMEILHLIKQVEVEGSDLERMGQADPVFVENKRARMAELFKMYKAKEAEIRTRKMESDAAKRLRK